MLYSIHGTINLKSGLERAVIYDLWASSEHDAIEYFNIIVSQMPDANVSWISDVDINVESTLPSYYVIRERENEQGYEILKKRMNRVVKVCEYWVISDLYKTREEAEYDMYALINQCQTQLIEKDKNYIAYSI